MSASHGNLNGDSSKQLADLMNAIATFGMQVNTSIVGYLGIALNKNSLTEQKKNAIEILISKKAEIDAFDSKFLPLKQSLVAFNKSPAAAQCAAEIKNLATQAASIATDIKRAQEIVKSFENNPAFRTQALNQPNSGVVTSNVIAPANQSVPTKS